MARVVVQAELTAGASARRSLRPALRSEQVDVRATVVSVTALKLSTTFSQYANPTTGQLRCGSHNGTGWDLTTCTTTLSNTEALCACSLPSTSSSALVSLLEVPVDCAGTAYGTATVDACGVCGGLNIASCPDDGDNAARIAMIVIFTILGVAIICFLGYLAYRKWFAIPAPSTPRLPPLSELEGNRLTDVVKNVKGNMNHPPPTPGQWEDKLFAPLSPAKQEPSFQTPAPEPAERSLQLRPRDLPVPASAPPPAIPWSVVEGWSSPFSEAQPPPPPPPPTQPPPTVTNQNLTFF